MSEFSVEESGGGGGNFTLGPLEITPSSGPGPLERLVKELLPDLEPEAG